jgi:Integrase zinc binding domain/Integrase core domain
MGHFGVVQTQSLVKERFYWPGMNEEVRLYIAHCPGCQLRNIQLTKPVELAPVALHGAFYMVGMDLTGPFSITKEGRSGYIITAIDYLTKWVEARVISRKDASRTAQFFAEDGITHHGCPQVVVTDNGQEWLGEFQQLLEECSIEIRKTSPYHPQAKGLVERFHWTLRDKLTTAALQIPQDWHNKEFYEILVGYRTSKQASTK